MSSLFLIATIAGERVAIDAAAIEAVVDLWQIVPVPLAAEHVIGVAAVRSRVSSSLNASSRPGTAAASL